MTYEEAIWFLAKYEPHEELPEYYTYEELSDCE